MPDIKPGAENITVNKTVNKAVKHGTKNSSIMGSEDISRKLEYQLNLHYEGLLKHSSSQHHN